MRTEIDMGTTQKIATLRILASTLNTTYLEGIADEMSRLHKLTIEQRMSIDALEAMRPHWAQGHTSDSVAAQTATTALSGLWKMLGVDNQTAACERLRELLKEERK